MLIVSYYTPNYAEHAARLKASCDAHGYTYWIEPLAELGKWEHNCARKGRFVYRALQATSQPVLWLDADAEIRQPLTELDALDAADCDLAVFQTPNEPARLRVRSGTVWFGQTKIAHYLAKSWAEMCEQDPNTWDQEHLYWAVHEVPEGVVTYELPETYCCRFCDPCADTAHVIHYQASRQLKRKCQT